MSVNSDGQIISARATGKLPIKPKRITPTITRSSLPPQIRFFMKTTGAATQTIKNFDVAINVEYNAGQYISGKNANIISASAYSCDFIYFATMTGGLATRFFEADAEIYP